MEHASQFNGDITSSDDSNALRLLFDIEETIRIDTVRGSRDILVLGDSRSAANSDNEFLRSDRVLGTVWPLDLYLILVEEGCVTFVIGYVVFDQILLAGMRMP